MRLTSIALTASPSPKGQAPEPLLSFPNGALVHFAVSNSEVYMVTKLDGPATEFLPFNQGDDGGGGQPGESARWPSHGLSLGAGVGAGKLAGNPGPIPHRPPGQEEADHRRSSSPATINST